MNYQQAMDYLAGLGRFGSVPGLERISKLLTLMGNPQDRLKVIHIAGTNGKGSTAAYCASCLIHAGKKTGMYISPYVVDFTERIQINRTFISKPAVAGIMSEIRKYIEQLAREGDIITEFEAVTAMAFAYFAQEKCDAVCLEVGLGGRFDATNVIKNPLVSVISSISFDHTEILGNTLEQIAFEKAGIIKPHCPVISYPLQDEKALETIRRICTEKEAQLIVPAAEDIEINALDIFGGKFAYRGENFEVSMGGAHQVYNAVTAVETVVHSGISITPVQLFEGIKSAKFPARAEVMCKTPLVILDAGHNLDGAKSLENVIKMLDGKKLYGVFCMMADKDYESVLALLGPYFETIYATGVENPRQETPEKLAQAASKYCKAKAFDLAEDAMEEAFRDCGKDGAVLIFGSLYLAAKVRDKLKNRFE